MTEGTVALREHGSKVEMNLDRDLFRYALVQLCWLDRTQTCTPSPARGQCARHTRIRAYW
jgi:hypothetical protein